MLQRYLLAPLAALLLLAAAPRFTKAQTGGVGIGTTTPDASAVLDMTSTSKGLLPPRMSQAQRDAIAGPATGLTLYNTTTGKLNTWDGTSWTEALNTSSYNSAAVSFAYTGAVQTYTVPVGVTRVQLDARGAQGGNARGVTTPGGQGARAQAILTVTPGQILYVYVGGAGGTSGPSTDGAGYNGGGGGNYFATYNVGGGGGGGASDVRTSASGTAYTDRLLTAAGGGGRGPNGGAGGGGGDPIGTAGGGSGAGAGATQSSGNALGVGGTGGANGAGGGGGYWGGAGGASNGGGGGGGSSWVTPTGSSANTFTAGVQSGNGSVTISPFGVPAPVLSGANFVNVPGDNLGNHTATQNLNLGANALVGTTAVNVGSPLNLGTNQLVGNGGSTGLRISSTGGVGIGTAPDASAALDVSSTSKGLLPPRLTQAQRDAIASPATGLTLYNTDTNKLNTWNGTAWDETVSAAGQTAQLAGVTFTYTGAVQTYTVPAGVSRLGVAVSGAQGGRTGGNGAQVQTQLSVTPGQTLYLYVGGAGTITAGGYNGGGNGGTRNGDSGGGGGGASDVRSSASGTAYTDRLVVAAGGGGGANNTGGAGGAPNGAAGIGGGAGSGATQTSGNALGQGGNNFPNEFSGGGGGGYWGGSFGASGGGSGGGGSSFVTATGTSATSMTAGTQAGNGVIVLTPGPQYLPPAPALSGANFVNIPGDNLGNHTATQNLNLGANALVGTTAVNVGSPLNLGTNQLVGTTAVNVGSPLNLGTNQLVGNGGSTGLRISSTGGVGIGTAPDASAALDVSSTSKGLLPPRLTQAQRDAIASPATGLTVYNTTTNKLNTWNGTNWDASLSATEQGYQGPAVSFAYTGGVQTYTVPAGVTSLLVDARGAAGGNPSRIGVNNCLSGLGARVQATLSVVPGQVLQVLVGGAGTFTSGSYAAGGYNGGGGAVGGGGGGATDVRGSGGTLTDRLLVAGGGGGSGYNGLGAQGGAGGAPIGGNGTVTGGNGNGGTVASVSATGGTQTAGGSGNQSGSSGQGVGSLGQGGSGIVGDGAGGGGGGGGYYGGGAVVSVYALTSGGGGGGSSWVTPTGSSGVVMTAGVNAGDGTITLTPTLVYPAPALNGANLVNVPGTWQVSGSNVYRSSGNVGIGTASPSQTLDVNGNANVSGRVGIGVASPSQALDVNGGILARASNAISTQGAYLQWNRSGVLGETWLLNQQGLGPGGIYFGKADQSNNATEWARFDANGNLGIGTTSPIAKLHVSGSASATPTGSNTSYFFGGSPLIGPQTPNGGGARATAAYFDGGQVWVNSTIVAGALNTTSDRRIKRVISLSDRAADLALLNRLRITDYSYIDQYANTPGVVKKVIAQEVEQVLPTAVSHSTQAIPNVYEKATRVSFAHGQLTVTTAKPHELPASGGRLRFYTPADQSLDVDVTVVDAHTVRFASAQAYASGLFVYGKYVDDFRSVDYDALTTLNVSATQELARKVEALEQQNAALQTKAAQAMATLETFEARLRRLEAGGAGQAQR